MKSVAAERKNDVLVFFSTADDGKKDATGKAGDAHREGSDGDADGRPDLPAILRRLGELEITSRDDRRRRDGELGGAGGKCGGQSFPLLCAEDSGGDRVDSRSQREPGFRHMKSAAQVKHLHLHRFGEDFAVEGYVRDPYGE